MPENDKLALLDAIRALAAAPVEDAFLGKTIREMLAGRAIEVPPKERELMHLKVRTADGTKTNVTIPAELVRMATIKLGGEKAARARVRELASKAPPTNNRSGWVQDQLARSLAVSPA